MADISNIAKDFKSDENEFKDSKFVKYLIKEKVIFMSIFKVIKILFLTYQSLATIPTTVFYSDSHKLIGENNI